MIAATSDTGRLHSLLVGMPEKVRLKLADALLTAADTLRARVEANLSGEVLTERSGALKRSIAATTEMSNGDELSVSVASDGSVPYARILEYGGRISMPEIVPRAAKVLAFPYGGRLAFAKHVAAHTVTIPEHSYLRSALDDESSTILETIRNAVSEALS